MTDSRVQKVTLYGPFDGRTIAYGTFVLDADGTVRSEYRSNDVRMQRLVDNVMKEGVRSSVDAQMLGPDDGETFLVALLQESGSYGGFVNETAASRSERSL